MSESNVINDAPIEDPSEDRFGLDPFAKSMAKSIQDLQSPVGTTIALNGKWGCGKSSAINLIKHYLQPKVDDGSVEIVDFKCWWFRGEEALTIAFLQELDAALTRTLGEQAKELIPNLGKRLLQGRPLVGAAISVLSAGFVNQGTIDAAQKLFGDGESIETLFEKLSDTLAKQDKRLLVIIDDIDRLAPDEALLIFRLVKSVGRLPNVIYLLSFDREVAQEIVDENYSSERGSDFLEKIIQASFEIPLPARDDLNSAVLDRLQSVCGDVEGADEVRRFLNVYYDAVAPYMNSPRDLTRLANAITISWTPVAGEVNVADFVALEVMRIHEIKLYKAIRASKDEVCGTSSGRTSNEDTEANLNRFVELASEQNREHARTVLMRLFPRFENTGYSDEWLFTWEQHRLVCSERHFDTYFRMSVGDEAISINEINEIVEKSGDAEFVKQRFREALATIRSNGKSKVPLLFEELSAHAPRIGGESFEALISALFEIADEIDRKEDGERGGLSVADNHLRIHWLIRRLTFDQVSLEKRNEIFLAACKGASVGWLTDFTRSAISDHFPGGDRQPTPEEKCLVEADALPELKQIALEAINDAASSGKLLDHPRLANILFRWREFADDSSAAVKTWTDTQLDNDHGVAKLAKALTSETWSSSLGMFGLGDRVSMSRPRAGVEGLETILDREKFRTRLEELEHDQNLDQANRDDIQTFLSAWRDQEQGQD